MSKFFSDRFGPGGFAGEHLWLGHLGHFFIVFSFCASILAFISYFAAEYCGAVEKEKSWRRLARTAFIAHGTAVAGVFVLLFVMILNHWFEYHYAWRHSSTELPVKYHLELLGGSGRQFPAVAVLAGNAGPGRYYGA